MTTYKHNTPAEIRMHHNIARRFFPFNGIKDLSGNYIIGSPDEHINNEVVSDNGFPGIGIVSGDLADYLYQPTFNTYRQLLKQYLDKETETINGTKKMICNKMDGTVSNKDTVNDLLHKFFVKNVDKKLNGAFIENYSENQTFVDSNEFTNLATRPLSRFLNVSLYGSCSTIVMNLAAQIYKSDVLPYNFTHTITNQSTMYAKMQRDIVMLTSASLHYGTMGGENPYSSALFENAYASLNMPTVYVYDKTLILKMMESYSDEGITTILRSMLLGNKLNDTPSFFLTEDYINDWAYVMISGVVDEIAESLVPVSPVSNKADNITEIIRTYQEKTRTLLNEADSAAKSLIRQIVATNTNNRNVSISKKIAQQIEAVRTNILLLSPLYIESKYGAHKNPSLPSTPPSACLCVIIKAD